MTGGWLYNDVARLLVPYGLLPGQYIRELRREGVTYPDIVRCMEADGVRGQRGIFHTPTLRRWEKLP